MLEAYERWQASRVDVSRATATYQRSAIRRAKPLLGRPVDEITAADVAELVGELTAAGKARETTRKSLTVLAVVFDFAGVQPNPARDRILVRLPREERPRSSRRPRNTSRQSTGYSRLPTGCRCSSSTRPGCAWANSSG